MVSRFALLASLLVLSSAAVAAETGFYAVEQAHLKASGLRAAPIAVERGIALLELKASEFDRLKDHLHESTHTCGGIIDLAPYMTGKRSTLDAFHAVTRPVRATRAFDKSEPTSPAQVGTLLAMLSADRYRAYLTRLATFADRTSTTQNGVDAAAYLVATARALGEQYGKAIEVTSVETGGRHKQSSTIVKIAGTRPELPALVLGAHMDTTVQSFFGGKNNPGADDDGSGSASVLEVLHAFLASPLRLERTVHFMFYAAEEAGLVGSGVIANKFKAAATPVRGVLQLDMTGYHPAEDSKMYFMQDFVDPALSNFLEKLAVAYAGVTQDQIGRDKCGYGCSDHASWHKTGFSAAIPFEASMRTMNPKIHTKDDALGMIDWAHAQKFVKLAAAFLVEAGEPVSGR